MLSVSILKGGGAGALGVKGGTAGEDRGADRNTFVVSIKHGAEFDTIGAVVHAERATRVVLGGIPVENGQYWECGEVMKEFPDECFQK